MAIVILCWPKPILAPHPPLLLPPPSPAHTKPKKKNTWAIVKEKIRIKFKTPRLKILQAAIWATCVGWRSKEGLSQHNFRHKTFGLTQNYLSWSRDLIRNLREIICKRMIPVRASFSPVSMSGILGTNTPGVSRTYMLGWCAICG